MELKIKKMRTLIQLAILSLVTVAGVLHQTVGGGPEGIASIHALCPFGGIESFYSLVTQGEFIKKTFYSNIILIGGSTFLVFILGKIFCGWICALGTMQDIFGSLGKKIIKKRYEVPKKIDNILRYLKFAVLIGIIYFTWRTGQLVINYMDPFAAYSHISAGWEELLGEYIIGFGILVTMLIASLFYDRLFCRYICPLGAYYAILGKFSLFKIKREKSSCINCSKCDRVCPAGLDISSSDQVKISECLGCMECVNVCPAKNNSLKVSSINKRLSGKAAGGIGVAVFLGIILITKSIGLFQTTPNNISNILKGNPDNIRGWMTLQDVSEGFDIPLKKIYLELKIKPEDLPPDSKIKESEDVLKGKGIDFDHDQIGEVVLLILGVNSDKNQVSSPLEIRGNMSIEMISRESGLTPKEIIKKLKLPEEISYDISLKNLSSEYGFEMEEIKERWSEQ